MATSRDDEIFAEALMLTAGKRAEFLDRACAGDSALRGRIEDLLRAHEFSNGPFDRQPLIPGFRSLSAAEQPGDRIGRYKLLQKIGEGGCGIVYMAEQEEPVRRRVALKIIKLGMDTSEVIARFEAERQALALMDHPNIAKVLDAGATDSGRPFFVMELVRGLPVTRYCDEGNLSTSQRLEIFSLVCHAVQHAHQKGVIHRDLKPSNILVTLHDGTPVPKVIDFGIAKATQGRLTDHTLFTAFEQFLGTPAYMSPEQAEMSGLDIDTRSDIYSLGVLLYELLTGRPPFDPKSLAQAGLDEMRRHIREVEPPKPSTRLATLTDSDRATVARLRSTAPAQLSTVLRGDLDWIVMRCLEKDRTRRYETASALAADIQHHLRNEPVVARPPSTAYVLQKLVRRHRFGVTATAAVAFALVAGTGISIWQAVRATRAERVATLERHRALEERTRAENLFAFMLGDLRGQLEKVGRLDVLEAVGNKAMAYYASLNPLELTDALLAGHAKALTQIGEIRMAQARYADATAAFSAAYGRAAMLASRHPADGDLLFERGQAEFWNGFVNWKRGEFAAAGSWLTRYHDTCQALVGLDPARPAWQSELAHGQHNLAALSKERGEFAAARVNFLAELVTLEKLRAANPGDPDLRFRIADTNSWLGGVAEQQGEFAEAMNRYAAEVTHLEQLVMTEPGTARWRFKLADAHLFQTDVLMATGRLTEAGNRLKDARRLLDELVAYDGSNRRWLAATLHSRLQEAMLARRQGNPAAAAQLVGEARPRLETLVGAEPSDRAFVLWLATAWRLEAQLGAATGEPGALPAAIHAAELGDRLIRDGRATDADAGECALALVLAGEIARGSGDDAGARRHWQHAAELLAPRLRGTRDWRLLDPAARAAAWTGRADEAHAMIAQLNLLGYLPLDPWPAPERLGAANDTIAPPPK